MQITGNYPLDNKILIVALLHINAQGCLHSTSAFSALEAVTKNVLYKSVFDS